MVTHRPLSFVKGPEEIISRVREFESDGVRARLSFCTWCGQPGPVEGVGAGGGETEGKPHQGVLTGEVGPPQLTEQSQVPCLLRVPAVPGLLASGLHGHQETLQLVELQSLQDVAQSPPPPTVLLASLASQSGDQL